MLNGYAVSTLTFLTLLFAQLSWAGTALECKGQSINFKVGGKKISIIGYKVLDSSANCKPGAECSDVEVTYADKTTETLKWNKTDNDYKLNRFLYSFRVPKFDPQNPNADHALVRMEDVSGNWCWRYTLFGKNGNEGIPVDCDKKLKGDRRFSCKEVPQETAPPKAQKEAPGQGAQ